VAVFFEGFELGAVELAAGRFRLRRGGEGPPLLPLHGNPQTHAMWHEVAPALARAFTVFCPDLRGYGESFKPPATADHAAAAKREMARHMLELMAHFGHEQFFLAAHDRGARVAHRLALDHPGRVRRLAVMDIVPTLEHFERANMAFGLGYYHWFWLAQPHPFPETLISAAPEGVVARAHLRGAGERQAGRLRPLPRRGGPAGCSAAVKGFLYLEAGCGMLDRSTSSKVHVCRCSQFGHSVLCRVSVAARNVS